MSIRGNETLMYEERDKKNNPPKTKLGHRLEDLDGSILFRNIIQ